MVAPAIFSRPPGSRSRLSTTTSKPRLRFATHVAGNQRSVAGEGGSRANREPPFSIVLSDRDYGAVVTAVENERKRLSRELHDEFLQSLVALKIRVKLLASEPVEEDRLRARAQIAREIDDTIRGLKRMIRGLLPPELESRRLSSALD
ncbi:MAG: hypothetical protein F4Z59_07315, partial [Gemmatimonadales bacterium]|nr:hypothetical protein [Gemmatimonadales bacterium]